jgi:hypothetical protein
MSSLTLRRSLACLFIVVVVVLLCSCQSAPKNSQFHKGWSVESFGAAAN